MNQDRDDEIGGSSSQLSTGQRLGHFRVLSQIGSGGMGTVFLAQDLELDRKVALKYLSPELEADEQFQARFRREAKILANLNHPNIVGIHEIFQAEGRSFIAMEYVEGQTLSELKNRALEEVCQTAIEIASGLKAAHETGIIHRDIKPANILVNKEGRVKILDFGLAKRADDQDITRAGATAGTFAYMSPEQVTGAAVDRRSDIFSLGIVLYELVLGRRPFRGEYAAEIAHKIVSEPPSAVEPGNNDAPPELLRIIGRCLEKNPVDRYQDAGLLVDDLKHFQRILTEVRHSVGLDAASTYNQLPSTPNHDCDQFKIPSLPPLPKKVPLVAGFLAALAGIVLLVTWTPRQQLNFQTVTASPSDAEAKSLDLLKKQGISLFGFHSYTTASDDDETRKIIRSLSLPDSAIQALEPWLPSYYYLTRVVSADGQERYDVRASRHGTVFSFAHVLRPDARLDTISADTARSMARRFSEDVLGISLSGLEEMPISVRKSAEGTLMDLQWVMENGLPGDAVGEVRASFAGSHLTSIGKNASFPEVARKLASAPTDLGTHAEDFLFVLAIVFLGVLATRKRAWCFPSWRVIIFIAVPTLLLVLLLAKPAYYAEYIDEDGGTAQVIFAMVMLGVVGAVFVILAFAAAFGILAREKPSLLAGLQGAPDGRISSGTAVMSAAIGMVVGALAAIVDTLSRHLILAACGMDRPMSLPGDALGGTVLAFTVFTLVGVIVAIGSVSVAMASSVVLAKYLRSATAGWLFVAIVWANMVSSGSFLSSDGATGLLVLPSLCSVIAVMWVASRYGLLAGVLTISAEEILSTGLFLTHFATDYHRIAGYTWLGIWLLLAAISTYYVVKRSNSGWLAVS